METPTDNEMTIALCSMYNLLENAIGRKVCRDHRNAGAAMRIYRAITDKRREGERVSLEIVYEVDVSGECTLPETSSVRVCPVYHTGPSRWSSNTIDDQSAVIVRCGGVLSLDPPDNSQPLLGKITPPLEIGK